MNTHKNARILITGGAGFIGSHLADELITHGFEVTVIDNLSNGSLDNLELIQHHPNFNFIEGDILDVSSYERYIRSGDIIFHLACLGVRNSIHSPFENHQANAEGSLRVLDLSRKAGVKHFFYISTSEVYGRTTSFPITEKNATNPLTVYGASKLAGEHYANAFNECYNLPVTILRIFNNYGPRAHYEGDAGEIIPRSIVKVLYNEPPLLFGNGDITRDFFFVKDTARALRQLLEMVLGKDQSNLIRQTINVGTGTELSMRNLIEQILFHMNRTDLKIDVLNDRPADVPRLWVQPAKFSALTNFKSSYTFSEGLQETISYYAEKFKMEDLLPNFKEINWIK